MTDAAPLLRQVNIQVLVIIGKKDIQVGRQTDGEPLKLAAAKQEEVTFLFSENANHVLKQDLRSREDLMPAEMVESYNAPNTHLDPQTLASMQEWLAGYAS